MQDEILKFYELSKAKVCDETTKLFINLAPQIRAWLSSDEFRQNYSHLTYAPLLNPKNINYETSEPELCFILNIPLPPFFDFFIFGSHGVSLESAVPGFLKLCGCKCVARDGEDEAEFMYISYFKRLVLANKAKQNNECVSVALLIADFIQDELSDKFYALVPRAKTLYIVRDPITNLKTLCNLEQQVGDTDANDDDFSEISSEFDETIKTAKRKARKHLAYRFSADPYILSKDLIKYSLEVDGSLNIGASAPSADVAGLWMRELYQCFHDGMLFNALININQVDILIKKTEDLIGKNAMPTMCELARHFGFLEPKPSDEWLFNLRVSDYKALLPATLLANANESLYNENSLGGGGKHIKQNLSQTEQKENKVFLIDENEFLPVFIHSVFMDNSAFVDISELFEISKLFCVLLSDTTDAMRAKDEKMLAKLRPYIKELCACLEKQSQIQKAKKLSENDILEYFKTHEQERMMFYGLLKQHLRVLGALRPDILAGYKYYQQFLSLCEQDKDKNEYRLIKGANNRYIYALFSKERLRQLGQN